MKKAGLIFIILALILTVSCEKDLELAKWEEISVIYSLINIKDSAQYLRINRVYSTDNDPLNYTQINDSVNYPGIKRRARGVDYMLALPGKELRNFIQVYEQLTNPHFFPDYSNLQDGFGIFGSKYYYTYFGLKLKKRTIDTISWGRHLINHRFADSKGEWH